MPNSWRVSSRAWSPRWFWPSFAAPATLYLLVFFVFPFYVVLAVTFGTTTRSCANRSPTGTPWHWNPSVLQFTVSNLTHTDGLYYAAFIHTIVFVGIATMLCLLIGYPVAYFLARTAVDTKGCSWSRSSRRSGSRTCCGCSRGSPCCRTTAT